MNEGPGVFYDGYIGENLVKDVQENNEFINRKVNYISKKIDSKNRESHRNVEEIIINKDYINKNLDNLVKDTDLSKFIL